MRQILIIFLILFGVLGIWLLYWDLVDFITTGLNNGLWDMSILANGLPSICAGIFIIIVVSVLGVKVLFK